MSTEFIRTNAEWAAEQIRKHGRDRYPTVFAQFVKLVEEVGELGKEINKVYGMTGCPVKLKKQRMEMADVALALYNLANKLGIDLEAAIAEKVLNDDRRFD